MLSAQQIAFYRDNGYLVLERRLPAARLAGLRETLARLVASGLHGGPMENDLISIVTFGAFYALPALGLNLIWGMTGMVNLGLAGFFAPGAYASALATTGASLPMVLGLVVAFGGAGAAGALLILVMRFRPAGLVPERTAIRSAGP